MRRHRLTFLFLLFSLIGNAQFPANESKWGVTLSPAIISDPTPSFGLQAGAEYRLSDRFHLLADIAFPVIKFNKDSLINRKYIRFKTEARYLFKQGVRKRAPGFFLFRHATFNKYIGIQLSYASRSFEDVNGGAHFVKDHADTVVIAFSHANIKSPIFTASLQYGAVYEVTENFYIDAFIGIGSRTIDTKYSNVTNPQQESQVPRRSPIEYSAWKYPGSVTRVHANAGIRFIYRFD